jgi:hypothetical protein
MAKAKKKDPTRAYLATCLGKVVAYYNVGNKEEANAWAHALVTRLKRMGLLSETRGVDKPG